jgi:hypothetical protein
MATIQRIVVAWNGLVGLPGESVFYGVASGTANADLKTFFTAIQSVFPAGLTWTIPGSGDTLDSVTGDLLGSWTNAAGAGTVPASGAASYAAGTGTWVVWQTNVVIGKRRLKGRTFLAPLMNSAYANGVIVAGNVTTMQTAATALVTAAQTVVWHRPVAGAGGSTSNPSAASVQNRTTSLKTRRS